MKYILVILALTLSMSLWAQEQQEGDNATGKDCEGAVVDGNVPKVVPTGTQVQQPVAPKDVVGQ
ncbi:MAG: hypothetical protein K2P81_04435 [Bacteriovoracaceae bacterium]|nr:hypothetical protein [Bacteriovoracaceae bacterium]